MSGEYSNSLLLYNVVKAQKIYFLPFFQLLTIIDEVLHGHKIICQSLNSAGYFIYEYFNIYAGLMWAGLILKMVMLHFLVPTTNSAISELSLMTLGCLTWEVNKYDETTPTHFYKRKTIIISDNLKQEEVLLALEGHATQDLLKLSWSAEEVSCVGFIVFFQLNPN